MLSKAEKAAPSPTSTSDPARPGDQKSQGRQLPPRERMVRSAAQLIRRRGVSGTGMREIVVEADAPRGSLQHYFPNGKEGLVAEALRWMGDVAARRVRRHVEHLDPPRPSALLAAIVEDWRVDLTAEEFTAGCPLVAAAADVAATSDELREVLRRAFDGWQEPLAAALGSLGVPPERSDPLAVLVVAALEGAIVLARIRRSLAPLDDVAAELGPLLDASVRPAPSRRQTASSGAGP
jgi:AcrR family transcriptional regulator